MGQRSWHRARPPTPDVSARTDDGSARSPNDRLTLPGARSIYFALLVVTIALGLASRHWSAGLPGFVGAYAGDTLWAIAAYWALALATPHAAPLRRALLALSIAVAVEVSQLFHPDWLEAVRRTRIGGWLLGFGFLWSDLACYGVGVVLAMAVDQLARRSGSVRDTL